MDATVSLCHDTFRRRTKPWRLAAIAVMAMMLGLGADSLMAQEAVAEVAEAAAEPVTPEAALAAANEVKFMINNLWVALAGCLVFIMHLGFATLESGLTRSKNTVNILFKNTLILCIGLLTYGLIGFALMYPGEFNGFLGYGGWGITKAGDDFLTAAYNPGYTWYTDFFFQAMFAATAATIISGAVAERIKLSSFLIFAALFVAIAYPITGSWQWGGGWLKTLGGDDAGFYDFAGSTLVHSVGGWGALVMAILIGSRLGKYNKDGSANAIPGHNMTLAAIGVFLLWFGWFGFNGGSVLSADPGAVSLVLVTTSMAAAAGGLATALVSWFRSGKPDLSMTLNGVLAGLVGITAGADQMAIWEAVAIGGIAGVLVYFAVVFVDNILRVDDPVGAISVHLVCGIWGTLAVGIFGAKASLTQLGYQTVGIAAIGAFTVAFSFVIGFAIKAIMGLRVDDAEQAEGLDLGEHGMSAYPDFQPAFIKSAGREG